MINKIGTTLVLIVGILFLVQGARMAAKVGYPYVRKVSTSLADALQA
jgi:hypothetical protein